MSDPRHALPRKRRRVRLLTAAAAATLLSGVALVAVGCASGPTRPDASVAASAGHGVSVEAASRVAAKTMQRSVPERLRIPAIAVSSPLVGLGLGADGALEVPLGPYPAGWFTGAPTPGELGPAVIVGHVSYNGVDGVFHDLRRLEPGDKIVVERRNGSVADFRVTRVAHYAKNRFPSADVYGDIDRAGLRLITCGGFDAGTDTYRDNVVVFADLYRSVTP